MLLFHLKNSFHSEDIYVFVRDYSGYVGRRLGKKPKVNIKIYDVTNRNTNNYNKHTARYLRN